MGETSRKLVYCTEEGQTTSITLGGDDRVFYSGRMKWLTVEKKGELVTSADNVAWAEIREVKNG